MTTAFDFLVNFWRIIDKNGSMTWTISDNHISILYYFNDENLDFQKILDVLNSYARSFGLAERGWKLPFKMQVSNSETWNWDYFERIEFVVKRWFFLGEKKWSFLKDFEILIKFGTFIVFFLKKVIRSNVMVGSCSKQTELLFDFDEIMKDENLSEEQKRVEFLKWRPFH